MSPHFYDFGVSLFTCSSCHIRKVFFYFLSISTEQPANQRRALSPWEPPATIRLLEEPPPSTTPSFFPISITTTSSKTHPTPALWNRLLPHPSVTHSAHFRSAWGRRGLEPNSWVGGGGGERIACRLLTLISLDRQRLLLFILPFPPPPPLSPSCNRTDGAIIWEAFLIFFFFFFCLHNNCSPDCNH